MFSRVSVRNTQPFILSEMVPTVCRRPGLSNWSCLKDSFCRSGVTFSKLARSDFDTANSAVPQSRQAKLPLPGAGCPFIFTGVHITPYPVLICPTYEPNPDDGEYAQSFRVIHYNRTSRLRLIAHPTAPADLAKDLTAAAWSSMMAKTVTSLVICIRS